MSKSLCKKLLLILFSCSFVLASCASGGDNPDNSNAPSNSDNNTSTPDNYDSTWKPGDSALEGNIQPEVTNPQGVVNDLGKIRKSQDKNALPQSGQANVLVVPVQFKDAGTGLAYGAEDLSNIDNDYFGIGTGAYPSVSDYYRQSSYDKLHITGVTTPEIVTLPNTLQEYGTLIANSSIGKVLSDISTYVYNYLFNETKTYYYQDFDADDDGKVDNIALVYKFDIEDTNLTQGLTSNEGSLISMATQFHNSLVNFESDNAPLLNSYSWVNYDISQSPKAMTDPKQKNGARFFIQQVGSALGLPGLGDSSSARAPMGGTTMMDQAYNDLDSFSKYLLGWIEPQKIKTSDVTGDIEVVLDDLESSGDALLLSSGDTGVFGEYLLIDYYTLDGLNISSDSTLNKAGVRVTKVDSRLLRGHATYSMYEGNLDFDSETTDAKGNKAKYVYDFAFTNASTNPYASYGIFQNYALATILDPNGINRHMTGSIALTGDALFQAGQSFGGQSEIEGFYQNFAFDGNGFDGPKLGLSFSVDRIDSSAVLTVRKA